MLLDVYIGSRQLWNPTELCHSNAGQRNNLHRLQRLCVLSQRYLTLFQGKMQGCIFILFSSDLPLFTQQHIVQCPLGFVTLDKAAALALATSRDVTDLRQYINSDLGYSDLKICFLCIVPSFLIDPHFYTPKYSQPERKSAGQSKMNHR